MDRYHTMDRYDTMMPRLLHAEVPKPRLYQSLLVTAGIILTCYALLTVVSTLLPILRERIETNRADNVNVFRDRIIVHSKPILITMTPRSTLVLPPTPVPKVENVPRSYTHSDMREQAVPVPTAVKPIRPKLHPEAVVPDSDPAWYIFVPPGDAQHKSPDRSAPLTRWMQGEGFSSVRECERYRQQVVDDTAYERDHNEDLSAPYDYKIKLFANAECVSVQAPRLRQRR
jgi:hypothetical protein